LYKSLFIVAEPDPHCTSSYPGIDLIVIRQNTEGEYSNEEHEVCSISGFYPKIEGFLYCLCALALYLALVVELLVSQRMISICSLG
jgi:hypothetical protein